MNLESKNLTMKDMIKGDKGYEISLGISEKRN